MEFFSNTQANLLRRIGACADQTDALIACPLTSDGCREDLRVVRRVANVMRPAEAFDGARNDGRALYIALRAIPVALALALVAEWVL